MANILIIDDDPEIRKLLAMHLNTIDHMPMVVETLSDGLDAVRSVGFDLVFLDVNLPDGCGLDVIEDIKATPASPEIIIITGEGNEAGAEMAFSHGVWDYILKPFSSHEIKLQVERSLSFRESKKQKLMSENQIDRSGIIGSSPEIMTRLNLVARCAKTDANVLITGPTGTGKELFAKTIHINSRQQKDKFIVVDCAALPEQLVESVLFGHVKGAFTGADTSQEGLVKQADGGTLFLDEIGELPMATQTKFLRILQERKYKPVGRTKEIESKFRLVAATNRNLEQMVEENRFRSDLLFRLKTVHIELPPLAACKSDIKDMILHYIYTLCKHHGFENKGFVPEFLDTLETYDWPGNVRELINSLEMAILADPESPMLYPNYLPSGIRLKFVKQTIDEKHHGQSTKVNQQEKNENHSLLDQLLDHNLSLKQMKEKAMDTLIEMYLHRLMHSLNNDLDQVIKKSGLSKSHLYSLLKKYNISTK